MSEGNIRFIGSQEQRGKMLKQLILLHLMGLTTASGAAIVEISSMLSEKGYSSEEITNALNSLVSEGRIEIIQ